MTKRIYDRVRETSISTGTGNFALSGATGACLSFNSTVGTGSSFPYCIESLDTSQFEVGEGHLSNPTTLVRDTILQTNNNNTSLVDFGSGSKFVFISNAADRSIILDSLGTTLPVTGSLKVSGSITAIGSLLVQAAPASGSSLNTGLSFASLNNNATLTLPGTYGLLYIAEGTNTGNAAVIFYHGNGPAAVIISQSGLFSTSVNNASTINVYYSGSVLTVQNKIGSNISALRIINLMAG